MTATLKPPLRPENNEGYFEIIEGQFTDNSNQFYAMNALFGDTDDVLMFTTRNRKAPFVGKAVIPATGTPTTIESPEAEVIYFLVQDAPFVIDATKNPPTRLCTLYRRVRLLSPSIGNYYTPPVTTYCNDNDISSHFERLTNPVSGALEPTMVPNTLGDLTKRENRFAHFGTGTFGTFPFLVDRTILPVYAFAAAVTQPTMPATPPAGFPVDNAMLAPYTSSRIGDDVLLTNVLAFDVRVWDPVAPVVIVNNVAAEPGDPQWSAVGTVGASGAYVDLGYNFGGTIPSGVGQVNQTAYPAAAFPSTGNDPRVYDTFSEHYENDGVDQDSDGTADAATNGLDDDANGVVDDIGERDTVAPYTAPLRGIRVTIRVYEPNSKQIREAVVIQNFDTK